MKRGDRVRIPAVEGVVSISYASQAQPRVRVRLDGELGTVFVHPELVEVIVPTFAIGDVLTAESPEPPVGTSIVEERFGTVATRKSYGWAIAGGNPSSGWDWVMRTWREVRVVYVPRVQA